MSDEQVKEVENFLKMDGVANENDEKGQEQASEQAEQEVAKQEANEEKILTAFEEEQAAKGWNPNGPKSAEEWARAEPLYEELKVRGKEIKQMKRTIDELKNHMQKQEQLAYEKALSELNNQRREAIATGNAELVEKLDEERVKLDMPTMAEKPQAVLDFEDRHADWLAGTSFEAFEMQKFALERDQQLATRNLDPEEHMTLLEDHVQKKFPEYFNKGEASKSMGSAVESGTNDSTTSSGRKKKYDFNDLSAEQKQIARDFKKMGVMEIDDYISQLVDNGDIE